MGQKKKRKKKKKFLYATPDPIELALAPEEGNVLLVMDKVYSRKQGKWVLDK